MSLIRAGPLDTGLNLYKNFSIDRDSNGKKHVIQKADKINTTILDKCSYISEIEEIISGNSNFYNLGVPAGKDFDHT